MQAVYKVFSSLSFSFPFGLKGEVCGQLEKQIVDPQREVRTLTLKHPPLETSQHKLTERKWEPEHVNHNKYVFMWHSTCYTSQSFCLFILPYSSQNCVCVIQSLFWKRCTEARAVFSAQAEILIRNPLYVASKARLQTVDMETVSDGAQQTCYSI